MRGGGDPSPARIRPSRRSPIRHGSTLRRSVSAAPASAVFALFFLLLLLLLRVCGGGDGSGLAAASGGARSVCSGDESAVPAV